MPTNDPEYMKQYQKARRDKLKEALEPEKPTRPGKARIEPPVIEDVGQDRANGLPRTNYYGDWVDTIQGMDGHLINRILDNPAIKTPGREKK